MKSITICGINKLQMPVVGLGTWRGKPEETENAVLTALENGYRHIGNNLLRKHKCYFLSIFL